MTNTNQLPPFCRRPSISQWRLCSSCMHSLTVYRINPQVSVAPSGTVARMIRVLPDRYPVPVSPSRGLLFWRGGLRILSPLESDINTHISIPTSRYTTRDARLIVHGSSRLDRILRPFRLSSVKAKPQKILLPLIPCMAWSGSLKHSRGRPGWEADKACVKTQTTKIQLESLEPAR